MGQRKNQLQFAVFDWLRFPLIVGVVFIHCYGSPFDYNALDFKNLSSIDIFNLFRVCISKVLTHICVPTFFFISGYLFFVGMERWNYKKYIEKIKRRCHTLLIPFIIWNTISILVSLIVIFHNNSWKGFIDFFEKNRYLHLYWDCHWWNLERTNWLGGEDPASSPFLVPLWFLRDLIIVTLCSPIIYNLIKRTKVFFLLTLFICYISGVFIPIPGFSAMAFLFFSFGAYVCINNINIMSLSPKYVYIIYMITVALLIICTCLNGHDTPLGNYIYPLFVVSGFISLINLAKSFVENKIFRIPLYFSKSSFFIYLSHTILIIKYTQKLISHFIVKDNVLCMFIGYLATPIITISICVCIYWFLDRYLPSFCSVLTGNR